MKNGKKLEITVNGKTIAETEWSKTPLVMETEKESKEWEKIVIPIIQDKINRIQLAFEQELLNSKC